MQKKKLWIIVSSVSFILLILAIVLPITLLSLNKSTKVNLTFESKTIVYDGQIHYLEVKKEDSDEIEVTYENNGHKDVGSYEVIAHIIDAKKSHFDMKATLTILPASLEGIEFKDVTIPYDGSIHSIFITGILPDEIEVTYENNAQTDVGVYEVIAHFHSTENNYKKLGDLKAVLTITAVELDLSEIEFLDKTFVYDGTLKSLEISSLLPDGVEVTYENNIQTNAGIYKVTAHFHDVNGNYIITGSKQAILTIEKATYDMSLVHFISKEIPYDGLEHELLIEGILPNGVSVLRYIDNKRTEIGENLCRVEFSFDEKNYNLIPEMTATLTIVPSHLDSVYLEDEVFSYDGQFHSLTLHGQLPLGVTYEFINNSHQEVGSYEVIVRFNIEEYGELKATLTIVKADVDMSNIFFFGATFTYDGNEHAIFIQGNLPSFVKVTYQNNRRIEIGKQTAVAIFEVLDSKHYNAISNLYAELIILDSQLPGISFEDKTVVYDQSEHSIFIEGTLPDGISVTYQNNGQINAGSYTVIAHFVDATGQYQNLEDMEARLIILKADFAKNGIIFADREYMYDGSPHRVEIFCNDLPKDIIVQYDNNDQINAGSYLVTVSFIDPLGNYNPVAPITAKLIITRAKINLDQIIFKNEEYEYDGFEHSLTIHGELPAGVRVIYTPNSLIELGRILVTVSFIVDERNYEPVPSRSAYLTITKGPLENISLESKTVVYDGEIHSLKIEGELPEGVTVEYQNNNQIQAGVYEVIADFYDAEGYYNSLTAYLTIQKAIYDMSKVSFLDVSYVYDGTPHTLCITGELPTGVIVSYTANTLTNAGSLVVIASFIGNSNYEDIPNMIATLTIEKATITGVSFEGASFSYDGAPHSIYAMGIEEQPIKVLYYNNDKIDAGEHEVIASFVLLNENYHPIADKIAILTILPISMEEIILEDQTFILDGSPHYLEITSSLPDGVHAVYENNGQIYEGVYEVILHFESDTPNYILPDPITAILSIVSDGTYHSVVFHLSDDDIEIQVIKHNEGIENIPTPIKRLGYDGFFEGDFTHITSHLDVYPTYTEALFTIHFDQDIIEPLQVRYLASFTLPIPTKDEYLFKKWVDVEGNEIVAGNYIWTNDIIIYAVWQCKVVIKNLNDYVYEEILLDSNDCVKPKYPYSSYLEGFYLDRDFLQPFDLTSPVECNQVLYTKYVYDFDFIINEDEKVEIVELLDLTKEFYNLETPIYDLYPITFIPSGIFSGCSNIKEIHIPIIEDDFGIFFGSKSYENSIPVLQRQGTYYLPKNLSTVKITAARIPTFSFWNCNSITKVILENVEEVEGFAFQDCLGLTEIDIQNCQSFDEGVFKGCNNLKQVCCDSLDMWTQLSFYDALSTPMAYADEFYANDILIESVDLNSLEQVGNYQFYGFNQLKEVSLLEAKSIGNQAFMGCNSLQELWLGDNLEISCMDAFAGIYTLKSLYYEGRLEDWSKIVFQNQYATPMLSFPEFYAKVMDDYKLITEIHLNDEIKEIGDYQFYGFTKITSLSFSAVSTIGYKACSSMGMVPLFSLPDTIEEIQEDAFLDTILLQIDYAGTLAEWEKIVFSNAFSTPLCSNEGNITFGDFALNLEKIVLSNGTESVGNYQFYGFKNTKEVEIVEPLTSIGQNAFGNCTALESISFSSLENTIFMDNAFLGCRNLKDVYYTGSIEMYMHLTYKTRESNPLYYQAMLWINDSLIEEISISEDVKDYQFYGLSSLKKVVFEGTVKKIGRYSFASCISLTELIQTDEITSIGDSAFEGDSSLTQLSFAKITSIPNACFRNCSSLFNLEIPNVTSIGASAFLGCSSLSAIDLSNVEIIKNSAFYGCASLKSISLEKITRLEYQTFANCYQLESIFLPNTLTHIAYFAFLGCTKLEKMILPESVYVIEANAFSEALNLVIYAMHNQMPPTWRVGWNKGVKEFYWYSDVLKEGNYWHFNSNYDCIIW
ncbi:MAG: leucine-rich repeat protein [Roseburia sp.]|nr:leucine-rich repeat protein [Anaeroplasma bactoclasticum]MCM1196539.1 leucine-rich repeat protein [Roseburia sp.]MCM1557764.1 leucine-rich repeat protein [Anaeroplasma bactoclasticum]